MSSVALLQEDSRSRLRALDLTSFIVEAPAGAGKTELLTQRYLRLLAVVKNPEEVLALTFTNKAASEMRDRILGSMSAAQLPPAEDIAPHKRQTRALASAVLAQDAERGWGLLDHPGRLRITTLDALCASLARQMPYLSRFGAQPKVTDAAADYYQRAARRTLEMVEDSGQEADVVAAALRFMDNNAGRLERLIVALLARRDQWVRHAGRILEEGLREEVEAGFAELIARDLADLAALFSPERQAALMPPIRFAVANQPAKLAALLDWETPLSGDLDDLPRWQTLAALLLTGTGKWRRSYTKNEGFPADKTGKEFKETLATALEVITSVPDLEQALGACLNLPSPSLSDEEWATVEIFSQLLRLAAGQLWLAFQEGGEVDFIEIAARASLALGADEAPTDLAQALDYRISHLLVDEFQDTSPVQVELLEQLTRGWQPDDGRTLFVVGDPMQSIYRFRKADVGLFLRVRQNGIGDIALENLRLVRNNRSYPAIVEWVNRSFPHIFPVADDPQRGAVRYAPSLATRAAREDSAVHLHPIIVDAMEQATEAEAEKLLQIILDTRRAYPQESIAILVRARSHLAALVARLRRVAPEERFQAVEIEGLANRQHVQDLIILASALLHRADRVNWLALLRAPWCGLKLADLHVLCADDHASTIWQLMQQAPRLARMSEDGRQRLLQVRAILDEALAQRGRQHLRRWIEGVWLMLGGPQCLESPAQLSDIDALFTLIDELAAAGTLTPENLQLQAVTLFAPPDPLAGSSLQMMTIHKSKGLEFDTVIVPGLHRDTGSSDSSLLRWDQVMLADGCEHLLVAPMKTRTSTAETPSAFDYLGRLEAGRSAHEDERLLYVAATRAIRALHLVGAAVADDGKDDGLKPPASGTLLELLWPVSAAASFRAALEAGNISPAQDGNETAAAFVPDLLRLTKPALPEVFQNHIAAPADAGNEVLDETSEHGLDAAVGTLVHRALELMARDDLAHWSAEKIKGLRPVYQRWLQQQGQTASAAASGVNTVVAALINTLNSREGRWILSQRQEAAAEAAWSSREQNVTVNRVIDRIFIADGERWIVDYKTVQVPDNAPADFLTQRAETYRRQLEGYAGLFAASDLPLRLAIFYPLQASLVELH
ncbi:MAG: UvrD-helicase domain-containing protein [Rhodocyclaceae bacterium]|nr:UvrD-helicase domain-containing protein [Rhodocyclaceae bacterium]